MRLIGLKAIHIALDVALDVDVKWIVVASFKYHIDLMFKMVSCDYDRVDTSITYRYHSLNNSSCNI